jgi:hypothetical protein
MAHGQRVVDVIEGAIAAKEAAREAKKVSYLSAVVQLTSAG